MALNGTSSVNQAVSGLWLLWIVSWFIASRWSARTVKTTDPGERVLELLLTLAGAIALVSGSAPSQGDAFSNPLYTLSAAPAWSMVALVACGFAFCWWARVHLGQMWSANITLKEGHRIIDTGPYALVRHPIYTGILLSSWATAGVHGNPRSFLGAALVTLAFYLKARREEKLLLAELGPAYERYRRRVPMLLPLSAGAPARD
jgi:protein-S-isoprenylcysteine O-methyltransferase Ste14